MLKPKPLDIWNSDSPPRGGGRRGRPPGPLRCVVQLRVRQGGKVTSYYSVTLPAEPYEVMKDIQELQKKYKHR